MPHDVCRSSSNSSPPSSKARSTSDTERRFDRAPGDLRPGCDTYVDQLRRTRSPKSARWNLTSLSDETRDRLLDAFRTFPRE